MLTFELHTWLDAHMIHLWRGNATLLGNCFEERLSQVQMNHHHLVAPSSMLAARLLSLFQHLTLDSVLFNGNRCDDSAYQHKSFKILFETRSNRQYATKITRLK